MPYNFIGMAPTNIASLGKLFNPGETVEDPDICKSIANLPEGAVKALFSKVSLNTYKKTAKVEEV